MLFTDVKGSSHFYRTHGNLVGRLAMQRLNDILEPVISQHSGRVVKTIGGSLMACFEQPIEAFRAGVDMQKQLQEHNRQQAQEKRIAVRISVNCGPGIVENGDVFGDMVNTAGKMLGFCEGGELVITSAVAETLPGAVGHLLQPFSPVGAPGQLQGVTIYRVDWAQVPDSGRGRLCLLSITVQVQPAEALPPVTDTLKQYLQDGSARLFSPGPGKIDLIYAHLPACLAAAREACALCSRTVRPAARTWLRVGVHVVEAAQTVEVSPDALFLPARTACESASAGEVILTSPAYESLDSPAQRLCIACPASAAHTGHYYRLDVSGARQDAPLQLQVRGLGQRGDGPCCLYCGHSSHPTAACPSKLIQKRTNALERLGTISFARLEQLFTDMLPDIVRPLRGGDEEDRFDLLAPDESAADSFAVVFAAFYEISGVFQLHRVKKRFLNSGSGARRGAGGSVMMGIDCLRVSRLDEARDWFEKARKEDPNDYRPLVGLGLLEVERNQADDAFRYISRAMDLCERGRDKQYVQLLAARMYECAGDNTSAVAELRTLLMKTPDWETALYYQAVLLVQIGFATQGIAILKHLYEGFSPVVLLKVLIDPALQDAQAQILAAFRQEIAFLRSQCRHSFSAIKQAIDEYSGRFTQEDEHFVQACDLYRRASAWASRECFHGLMYMPDTAARISGLLERAVVDRRRKLFDRLSRYRAMGDRMRTYLDRYPYPRLRDERAAASLAQLEHAFREARAGVERMSGENLQRGVDLLDRCEQATRLVQDARRRLEFLKNAVFVCECSLKTLGCFACTAGGLAVVFSLLLLGVREIVGTVPDVGLLRFGVWFGFAVGAVLTVVWVRSRYREWMEKVEFTP